MYDNSQFASYHGQPSHQSGPPPAKKAKGNGPVITRYPPPPGYKGPLAQQRPSFNPSATFQPAYGQPVFQGYQQPAYQYPQVQVQVQYPYYPQQQQGYFPPQQQWQPAVTTPQSAPPTWQQSAPNPPPNHTLRRHNSAPFPTTSGPPLDGNGDPLPPMDDVTLTGEELEHEFDGECYYARYPDEINPELSLGLIEWKAPLPTQRALPSTFEEAELEAIAPRNPPPAGSESISDFFIGTKRDEAFLSVRQTDSWEAIRHNLIFREFAAACSEIITMSQLLEKFRCRYDPKWADADRFPTRSSTPDLVREPTPADSRFEMDIDRRNPSFGSGRDPSEPATEILDDLEQALRPTSRASVRSRGHSRTNSVSSQNLNRPKPLPPVRDQNQEDILAALGVTGSPKLVFQTPGPAFGPPPTKSASSSRHNSFSNPPGLKVPRPSSRQPSPSRDAWDSGSYDKWGNRLGCPRPGSANSQRTGNGSDVDAEPDDQLTPKPKVQRNENRKRSYADATAGAALEPLYEDDEDTPRQRKQARVDIYST